MEELYELLPVLPAMSQILILLVAAFRIIHIADEPESTNEDEKHRT